MANKSSAAPLLQVLVVPVQPQSTQLLPYCFQQMNQLQVMY